MVICKKTKSTVGRIAYVRHVYNAVNSTARELWRYHRPWMDTPVSGASHNHDPNLASVWVTKAKANLKSLDAQTRVKPGHLLARMLADLPDDVEVRLGKRDTAKKTIRRTRGGWHPPVLDSLNDLAIDGEWARTVKDEPEPFLIDDNGLDQ